MKIKIILLTLLLSSYVIVDSFTQEVPLVYEVENTGADCPEPPLPSFDSLPSIDPLTDPFEWSDGSGYITGIDDWRCRRTEIGAEVQRYEQGTKPPPPDSLARDERRGERLVPDPDPHLKIRPSVRASSKMESIVSSTELIKQAEHCGFFSIPTLNQTGELNETY